MPKLRKTELVRVDVVHNGFILTEDGRYTAVYKADDMDELISDIKAKLVEGSVMIRSEGKDKK
jgi:hypothetical protein